MARLLDRMQLTLKYFAILREQRGLSEETIETDALTPGEIYESLKASHAFSLNQNQLKVAVNDTFAAWNTPLNNADTLVFIPPVAGG